LILLVHDDAPLAVRFSSHHPLGDRIIQLRDVDWRHVRRDGDLFGVVVASRASLGDDPVATLRDFATAGAPPVIVLAQAASEDERIAMLRAGAALCLPDPVGAHELGARIARLAATREQRGAPAHRILAVGEWLLDLSSRRLLRPGLGPIHLTATEFDVLRLLVESHDRVLSREYLAEQIGKRRRAVDMRSVDVYVSRIRRRLKAIGADDSFDLRSARGEGYVCYLAFRPRLFDRPATA
jgi:two-component system OmpR family response regulator